MKKFVFLSSAFFLVVILFTTCKKQKAFRNEDAQDAIDVRRVQCENDLVLKEINEELNKQVMLRGYGSASSANTNTETVCGLIVDSSKVSKGILVLVYKNTTCEQRQRSGKITVTIQNYPYSKLKDQGCIIKIDFSSYSISYLSDGRNITISGTEYIENVSGGTWYELQYLNLPNLVQNVVGQNFQLKYSGNNIVSSYNVSCRYTYTCDSKKIITCTAEGTGTDGSNANIENWGTLRSGTKYTARVISAVVWNSNCGPLFPMKGEVLVKSEAKAFALDCVYGTDTNGNRTVIGCPYGWKVEWEYKNKSKSKVFAY